MFVLRLGRLVADSNRCAAASPSSPSSPSPVKRSQPKTDVNYGGKHYKLPAI
jgi:hypothetical protein